MRIAADMRRMLRGRQTHTEIEGAHRLHELEARCAHLEAENAKLRLAQNASQDAMRTSDARWQIALEGAGDGVWDWDVPSGTVFFSVRWKEMLGFADHEIHGDFAEWTSRLHPDDTEPSLEKVRQYLEGDCDTYYNEHRMRCKDGSYKWILARGLMFTRSAEGKPQRMVGTHTDITQRKRAELREASNSHTMALLVGGASLRETLGSVVQGIEGQYDGAIASVLLLDRSGKHLLLGAAPGLPEFYNEAIHGVSIGPKVGSCGTAAYRAARVVVTDIMNDPLWEGFTELAAAAGLAACWSEPILGDSGRVLGTFALYHRQVATPSEEQIAAVSASAKLAAVAIERVAAREALLNSTQLLEASQSIAKVGGWELDLLTDELYWTEETFRLFETTRREFDLSLESGLERFLPGSREILEMGLAAARERGQGFDVEVDFLSLKGRRIDLRVTCEALVRDGKPIKLNGILQDITERKQAQAALWERDRRLASVIDSAIDAIVTVDHSQNVLLFNRAAGAMFRCTPSVAFGKPLASFLPQNGESELQAFFEGSQHAYHGEAWALRADGASFPLEASITRVEMDGRAMFSLILRDVSERHAAEAARDALEAQLRVSQKMEAVGTLASGIAHDFNNILGAILGYTELIRQDAQDNPAVLDSIGEIRRSSERGATLVRQILSFSRQEEQQTQVMELAPIIEEVLKLLRSTFPSSIAFDVRLTADSCAVSTSAVQVHQILMNLGTNAAHAMRDRTGQLGVTLERCTVEAGRTGAPPELASGAYVRVTVSDTGHGMSATTVERIFDPFFTTKPQGEGTGLGLSVVHGLMSNHKGAIAVRSQIGEGTTIELYFPAVAAAVPASTAAPALPSKGSGQRILFVDDEEPLGKLGKRLLERLGYKVDVETRPTAALENFRARPEAYELVITDLTMPEMLGTALAQQLLSIRPDLPIIMATGYSDLTQDNIQALGIRELLSKPVSVDTLSQAIQRCLE